MLSNKTVKTFVVTSDPSTSKKFYGETLGFKQLSEDNFGIEFEMHNALLRVSITEEKYVNPQPHTILGWCVPDIDDAVKSLKSKGVVFERYEFLQQDENDIWQAPGGTKVAWFKDPNGHVLSIDKKM